MKRIGSGHFVHRGLSFELFQPGDLGLYYDSNYVLRLKKKTPAQ